MFGDLDPYTSSQIRRAERDGKKATGAIADLRKIIKKQGELIASLAERILRLEKNQEDENHG